MRSLMSRSAQLLAMTVAAPALALAPLDADAVQKPGDQNKKPSISVKANPPVGFSPLRVVVTAEIKGGADDFADFYCASVEWEWGDDTKSQSTSDCDPYEAGKSEIKRRFAQEHVFRALNDMSAAPGIPTGPTQFKVRFVLKQKNKVVGSGQTIVELRSGGE